MAAGLLVLLSAGGISLVFLLYPLLLRLNSGGRKPEELPPPPVDPSVSLVVVARNAESLIEEKLKNCLALDYPANLVELIFYSDGSTDGTNKILERYRNSSGIRFLASGHHQGKTAGLNRAVEEATGELLVFSDVDAILEPEALGYLIRYVSGPGIGGCCGQRVISEVPRRLGEAQEVYGDFDSGIKSLESRIGSITSNDGKLYCIRRKLFRPIPEAVTDDFFEALSIVAQGYRFTFQPRARAHIRLPSRTSSHEVRRRRRIVSRSLRAIAFHRRLLNPWKHGMFAIGLAINKGLRRFLPVLLLSLLLSTACLAFFFLPAALLLLLQLGFYAVALSHPLVHFLPDDNRIRKTASVAWYFCVGNYGTLLGLMDFLLGRKTTKWEPEKSD